MSPRYCSRFAIQGVESQRCPGCHWMFPLGVTITELSKTMVCGALSRKHCTYKTPCHSSKRVGSQSRWQVSPISPHRFYMPHASPNMRVTQHNHIPPAGVGARVGHNTSKEVTLGFALGL